ncbi:MAG: MMPL family transporter [Alicyclobacillus mali]|uniref:efflux RND transporter permease subunit n=1 Tax=Alicyclobacillus mali (ex Roth et al. 2021) TaxID=1123961 RepID=UPI0023F24791|nr:MMPL family transporter [Alicyclobacillus mali (ex Roth et al. 2021)]MCL6489433.1 MMPL family transporter [Alicyclobacillus mali (ex Roth et al. 2021)]
MAERYAHFVARFKYAIIGIWILAVALAHVFLPQLNAIVAHKNTEFLPNSSSVVIASNWLKRVDPARQTGSSAVVALYNPHGLTAADKAWFTQKLQQVTDHKASYGVKTVTAAYNQSKSVQNQFFSADRTVEIATIGFPGNDVSKATDASLNQLHQVFQQPPKDAQVLFTGDTPIENDNINISMDGASKTAGVTIALVLVILLVVFRSIVAPFLTLLSIGLSYLLTTNLVAVLANVGLPVSTFTDTFLIAIIFGAGTDYSIIVLNRFREEASRGLAPVDALARAMSGIAKTVVYSALTVFLSFATLYFARFGLFRSGVGVAVGVGVTLFACLTFLPALMMALGRYVFWPRRELHGASHKPSRIWDLTGRTALRHPWWTLAGVLVLLTPVALSFTDQRTFDPTSDIPTAPSVVGFRVVSKAFGPGKVLPMDVVIDTPDNLRTPEGLATIEQVSEAIAKLPFVQEVQSATRPTGKVISEFELAKQNQLAAGGLGKVQTGLNQVASHVGPEGAHQAANAAMQLSSGASALAQAGGKLSQGAAQAEEGASKLAGGAQAVSSGAARLSQANEQLANGAAQVAAGSQQTAQGANKLATSARSIASGQTALANGAAREAQAAQQLANAIAAWTKAHPTEASDPNWQQIVALAQGTAAGAQQTAKAAEGLATGTDQWANGATSLAEGAGKVAAGASQLATGSRGAASGAKGLSDGAAQVGQGASSLAQGLNQLSGGARQLQAGLGKWASGASQFGTGLANAGTGENQLHSALVKLSNGVGTVKSALDESAKAQTAGDPGFYVPASAISSNSSLRQALNSYISPDGHVADIRVTLKSDPYSMTAIDEMPRLETVAQAAFTAAPIHSGQVGFAGTTPTQFALNQLSNQDFVRMMALILGSIFILLVVMLRSLIAPLYVIASLTGTYFVTMGCLQFVAVDVMHKAGISWTVPFFSLLLLVALGVDYSIFLMSRFDEELRRHPELNLRSAMLYAMRQMGNVVFSAAAIMAGTFGSLSVSGVTTLVEIGLSVIIGLALYALIVLALFVPACTSIVGAAHFWPFRRVPREEQELRLPEELAAE